MRVGEVIFTVYVFINLHAYIKLYIICGISVQSPRGASQIVENILIIIHSHCTVIL